MNESVPGKSLIAEIENLTQAVRALVDINQQLCKKIESNEVKLGTLANFVRENSSTTPCVG